MSRYIDADKLKEVHEKAVAEYADCYTGEMIYGMDLVIQYATERAPSIDIVHCDKCIHNVGIRDNTDFYEEDIVCDYWDCDGLCSWDYCSYGKRKEG